MILYIGRVWQTNQESEMSEQPGDKHPQGTPTGSTSQQVEKGQCCGSGLGLGATVSKSKSCHLVVGRAVVTSLVAEP